MEYVALYRKWRPKGFKDLVGQEAISSTLTRAIEENKIAHAYLFSGPRGTGKTSSAKIFAMGINCLPQKTANPCTICASCQSIQNGSSMDVYEIDAASNRGIEEIRDLRESVNFAPVHSRYKVYIIDEVHMLTTEAFNALLKTLEEPPQNVVFILATTEIHKVPATIQSRCQRYDFKRISIEDIIKRLQFIRDNSKFRITDDALRLIAKQADGGMRDALSLLDQCLTLSLGDLQEEEVIELLGLVKEETILAILVAIADNKKAHILTIIEEILIGGHDLHKLIIEMIHLLRNSMIYQTLPQMEGMNFKEETLKLIAKKFKDNEFIPIIRRLHEILSELKWSLEPKISVETGLLEIANIKNLSELVPKSSIKTAEPLVFSERLLKLEEQIAKLSLDLEQGKDLKMAEENVSNSPIPHLYKELKDKTEKKSTSQIEPVAPAINNKQAQQIWQDLLERLQKTSPPIAACLRPTKFLGMNGIYFEFVTDSEFVEAKFAGDEYRDIVEKTLLELTGKEYKIKCKIYSDKVKVKTQKEKSTTNKNLKNRTNETFEEFPMENIPPIFEENLEKMEVDFQNLTDDERCSIEEAVSIFGDQFVYLPDKTDKKS